jgi:hypothetical protein
LSIKQFAGLPILAFCLGCAATPQGADPSIDLATFKCPSWLPSEEVYRRILARKNLTVAVVSKAKEGMKPLWSMCVPDGHGLCDGFFGTRGYTFGEVHFIENGQGAKRNSHFGVWYEIDIGRNTEEGFRLDPAKRYLILVSSTDAFGEGYFDLNAACELPQAQKP